MALSDKLKSLVKGDQPKKSDKSITSSNEKPAPARGNKNAKLIAVCSQKGGVGKTTSTVNLAAALAKFHNLRVLVVDLDPQGHVEKSLGALVPDGLEYLPLSELLAKKKGDLTESCIDTEWPNLAITLGDKTLYESEGTLASKIGREMILKNALSLARTLYDIILFDCPPNLGTLTLNALVASDTCIVPCEMSVLAFEGVSDLLETLELITERLNPSLSILGVVFTRVDLRNVKMNELIESSLKEHFKGYIFKTRITINTDLNKAQLEGLPIFAFAPSSSGATNYHALADEVVKKLKLKA